MNTDENTPNNRSPGRRAMRAMMEARAVLVKPSGRGRSRPRRDHATAAWNEPLNAAGLALPRHLRRAIAKVRRPLRAIEHAFAGALVRRERAAA